jgi:hypothetical protein
MEGASTHCPALETPVTALETPPAAPLALHYGSSLAPMVSVVPDDRWPGMWRMLWPSGDLSDMANLARIKDAAMEICDRGPPRRDRRRFNWKMA